MKTRKRLGPLIIGFDGSPSSECALYEAAGLLAPCPALVVVVWEAGISFELIETASLIPPPIGVKTALEIDQKIQEAADRLARRGTELARDSGLDAEGLAVADERTPAETLVHLAREHDARAVAVGTRGHQPMSELLLGSTSRDVVREAPCPVVVRGPGRDTPGNGAHRNTSSEDGAV